MTGDEMKAIRARTDAATEGPWEWVWEDASMQILATVGDYIKGHVLAVTPCKACQERHQRCLGPDEADAAFLEHARQDIPDLLDALADPATAAATVRDFLLSKGDPDGAGILQAFIEDYAEKGA